MEKFYQVRNEGVFPVNLDDNDIKVYNSNPGFEFMGFPLFANWSRAALCWYERQDANKETAKLAAETYSFILPMYQQFTGEEFADMIRKYFCQDYTKNIIIANAAQCCIAYIIVQPTKILYSFRKLNYPQ